MSGQLAPASIFQAIGPSGILPGAQLFTYAAGTTTPQATYTDASLLFPNTNPVIMNAAGQASVWLSPQLGYKFVLEDASGNLIYTQDNILGAGSGSTGLPGQNAIVLALSAPALQVTAPSTGVVSDFSMANGFATLYSGTTNITSQATWSLTAQVNCNATINNAVNVPVTGPVGYYAFTNITANVGTITVQALYQGVAYTAQATLSVSVAGGTGPAGPTGPTGAPGAATGLTIVLSSPVATVLAYANGSVPSFAGISGTAHLLNSGVDISEQATWSAVGQGLTGTVNVADNNPVIGQIIGYYQVTAMTQGTATLTITAVYLGSTLTSVFTVTQVPAGYQIVSALPTTNLFQGRIVFLTTDNQLYRYTGSGWTVAVPAVNITGTIGTTQISSGAITTPLLAANSVTAANIQANAITSSQLAANSVIANAISAGAVTAAKIGVTQLSAISANIGTVNAGIIQSTAGQTTFNLNSGYIEFNNGVNMKVTGVGFGSASKYLEWYGPTQSSASNFAACTDALAHYYLKTDGTAYFGGSINIGSSVVGFNGYFKHPPDGNGRVFIDQWGYFQQGPSSPQTVPFTIAFPGACVNVTIANALGSQTWWIANVTTSGFQFNFGASYNAIYWRAFGY
jgi:hypothetical protein